VYGWYEESWARLQGAAVAGRQQPCLYDGRPAAARKAVFELDSLGTRCFRCLDACGRYIEYAAKEYLLDGGTSNKSVVEQTLEIKSGHDPRMTNQHIRFSFRS
jgi:hypothetical protein